MDFNQVWLGPVQPHAEIRAGERNRMNWYLVRNSTGEYCLCSADEIVWGNVVSKIQTANNPAFEVDTANIKGPYSRLEAREHLEKLLGI